MRKFVGAMTSGLAGIVLLVAPVFLGGAVRAQSPPSGGLGVIEIRPWADGAGPSHIFWLTGDRFAVVTLMRGRSKGAHIATEMRTSGVIEVRDGLIVRIVGHSDPEDAIAAVNPQPP